MTMPTAGKVRVLRRGDGWWHWWCPCCMGGDFATSSLGGGWQSTYTWILGAALDHVRWHAGHPLAPVAFAMTLAEFLLTRIAEDEAVARRGFGMTDGRVLAECGAKRRIVELVTEEQPLDQGHWEGHGSGERWVADHAPEVLRLLALPYAGHPDYRAEWRP
jgi:hypothetical protein